MLYANLSGRSNVRSFEIGDDSIEVTFGGPAPNQYLYTKASVGESNLELMKDLARNGRGLNSFINKRVKNLYARKR